MDRREQEVVDALLEAYREGAFPMVDPRTGRMEWFSPDPRALMPLEPDTRRDAPVRRSAPRRSARIPRFHVSRSLDARIRSKRFTVTTDTAFDMVVRSCAEARPGRRESWIDDRIIWAYAALHRAGHAHSVEAWLPAGEREHHAAAARGHRDATPVLSSDGLRVLVGGVYGVSIGAAFFAESMFCRPELGNVTRRDGLPVRLPGTDASKVSLVYLVAHLRNRGYTLMDVQLRNPHTDQFGVFEVPRKEYLRRLRDACDRPMQWTPFDPAY
ncbi:MAG: leucyl/phenylalanyl-tRNA--protein transferase [Phycisphaerales bacterium]